MDGVINAAAYCRVSTDSSDQAISLSNQISFFNEYISRHAGWRLYKIYCDDGISGTSMQNREQFNSMISDAESGKFSLIITKEVSRFARNTIDTLTVVRHLKGLGIGVIFMNDGINTLDSEGELRLTIMSGIAQEESRKTSERVKWGQRRRMEQGIVFGHSLLGYTVHSGKLFINAQEAETVKLIYRKFLIEEKGCEVIANELNSEGINSKNCGKWNPSVILKILKNEKYVGDLCQKKTYTPDFLDHKKKYNYGEEDKIYIPDHHEAIIDRKQWEQVQAELERRCVSRRHTNSHWCSKKIICGKCGKYFVSRSRKRSDGSTYKSWRCYSSAQGYSCGCGTINDTVLLSAVSYVLKQTDLDKNELETEIINDIISISGCKSHEDIARFFERTEKIKRKKLLLIDSMAEGIISKEELTKQKAYYDKEIISLNAQIAKAQDESKIILRQNYHRLSEETKNILRFGLSNQQLFREILDMIVVYKNNIIEVRLKGCPNTFKLQYNTHGKAKNYFAYFFEL